MTDSIKPGDLVMVVRPRPCCGVASSMGKVGVAEKCYPFMNSVYCPDCGFLDKNLGNYVCLGGGWSHITRLKKINPPSFENEAEFNCELEAQ